MKLNKFYYAFAFLFYLVSTSFYVYTNYETSKQKLFADIDARLVQSALRIPTMLPENFHHVGMSKNDVSPQEDRKNIKTLSIHAKLSGVEYIYSCIKQGRDVLFTSSSATDEELKKNENLSHYFDVYDDAEEKLHEAFLSKKMVFEESTDKWGHFRSVFIPQVSSDGQFYIVCADVKIDYINQELKQILEKSIVELIFYMVILIPLFVTYVSHNRRHQYILETEVQRRTRELRTLLDNSDQGFLSFSGDMRVHPQYSAKCVAIFKKEIRDLNISDLLFGEDEKQKSAFVSNISSLIGDNDELRVENILSLLRSEFMIVKKTITVEYRKISTETFMLILTDVTEKRALEKRLEIEKNKLQMVVSAIENRSELFELLDEYSEFMANRRDLVEDEQSALDNITEIYREVHTFKGLFAQKDFIVTPMGLHKLEEKLSLLLDDTASTNEQLFTLMKKVELENWLERDLAVLEQVLGKDFLEKKDAITLTCTDIDKLNTEIRLCAKDAQLQEEIIERITTKVGRLKEKSLAEELSSYSKLVERLSQKLGKHLNPMKIECDKTIMMEEAHRPFVKSLVHLFRNCVDHGVESPEERLIRGKYEMGTISCTVTTAEDGWEICIQDDGAGIDTLLVAKTAILKGILTQEEVNVMSADAINLLIFNDHFSTKESISELSGRGIGLGALKHELEALGGNLKLVSTEGKGAIFRFFVPTCHTDESLSGSACLGILIPIATRARSFLSDDMEIELLENDFEISKPNILPSYPYAVKIRISGAVNALFIMGFEAHALEEVSKFFVVDAQGDAAYEFMKEHVACEVANTVLGNAITNFPNKGVGVSITPPFMIGLGNPLFKNAHTNLCTTEIKTSGGAIMLALLAENTIEDKLC